MTEDVPYLSVVLPAFRASEVLARNVPVLVAFLNSMAVTYEIVVVDDGSGDGGRTREVCEHLRCRYLEQPRNLGKGAAVRAGMLAATGRYRIYTDADIPFDVEVIQLMLRYLDFKEFDVVAGDRTLQGSRYFTEVSLLRRIASAICSTLVGRFLAGGWFDTQCGIKGFRAEAAIDLFGVSRINRFAIDVELLYVSLKRHYDIKRLPVTLRTNDTSSVRMLVDGPTFAWDLVRIRWNEFMRQYRKRPAARRGSQR
jgi:dolichyl-phosphate beta-glucosyltransferase